MALGPLPADEGDACWLPALTIQGECQRPEVVVLRSGELVEVGFCLGPLDAVDLTAKVPDVRPTDVANLHITLEGGCPSFLLGVGEDRTLDVDTGDEALGILYELLTDTRLVDGNAAWLDCVDERLHVVELFVVRVLRRLAEQDLAVPVVRSFNHREHGLVPVTSKVDANAHVAGTLVVRVPLLEDRQLAVRRVDDEVPSVVGCGLVRERGLVLGLEPDEVPTEAVVDDAQLVGAVLKDPSLGALVHGRCQCEGFLVPLRLHHCGALPPRHCVATVLRVRLLVRRNVVEQTALAERRADDGQPRVASRDGWHSSAVQLDGIADVRELIEVDVLATTTNSRRGGLADDAGRDGRTVERDFVVGVRPENRLEHRVRLHEGVGNAVVQVGGNLNLVGGFLLVDGNDVRLVGWLRYRVEGCLSGEDGRETNLPGLVDNAENRPVVEIPNLIRFEPEGLAVQL